MINGAAIAVRALASEQARRHRVAIYAPDHPDAAPEEEICRFPSYRLPAAPDYPLAFPFSSRCRRRFREFAPEIVHTHSPFALGQVGRLWARSSGVPVITTYHTLYIQYSHYARPLPAALIRWALQSLTRSYCNQVDAVVTPTGSIRDELRRYGVTSPIHVIATGLDAGPPAPADPEFMQRRFGLSGEGPIILFAGRLAPEKNLPLLLHSFHLVAQRHPTVRLLLCGSGPLDDEIRRQAGRLCPDGRIHFGGMVQPDLMPKIYASATLFAFSSLYDTQGLVLNEAKAAGLPAVAVRSYGPAEIISENVDGFLVDPDPVAMAEAIHRVLDSPALRSRLSRGALQQSLRFGIGRTAEHYDEVYREAMRFRRAV